VGKAITYTHTYTYISLLILILIPISLLIPIPVLISAFTLYLLLIYSAYNNYLNKYLISKSLSKKLLWSTWIYSLSSYLSNNRWFQPSHDFIGNRWFVMESQVTSISRDQSGDLDQEGTATWQEVTQTRQTTTTEPHARAKIRSLYYN
jgi:hypothetical protein